MWISTYTHINYLCRCLNRTKQKLIVIRKLPITEFHDSDHSDQDHNGLVNQFPRPFLAEPGMQSCTLTVLSVSLSLQLFVTFIAVLLNDSPFSLVCSFATLHLAAVTWQIGFISQVLGFF